MYFSVNCNNAMYVDIISSVMFVHIVKHMPLNMPALARLHDVSENVGLCNDVIRRRCMLVLCMKRFTRDHLCDHDYIIYLHLGIAYIIIVYIAAASCPTCCNIGPTSWIFLHS